VLDDATLAATEIAVKPSAKVLSLADVEKVARVGINEINACAIAMWPRMLPSKLRSKTGWGWLAGEKVERRTDLQWWQLGAPVAGDILRKRVSASEGLERELVHSSDFYLPVPWQVGQTTFLFPRQWWQGFPAVLPCPLQTGQVMVLNPLQVLQAIVLVLVWLFGVTWKCA
jgi:hypothetical protein